MKIDDKIFELISQQPGITPADIAQTLTERSWVSRLFGPVTLLGTLFSPGPEAIYPALERLETEERIRIEWGEQMGPYRRQHYYPAAPR